MWNAKAPVIGTAKSFGNQGSLITVSLVNGKVVKAIALTPISQSNVIVIEATTGKFYVYGSKTTSTQTRVNSFNKNRGGKSGESTYLTDAAILVRTIGESSSPCSCPSVIIYNSQTNSCEPSCFSVSSYATYQECITDNFYPEEAKSYNQIAYLYRGYWDTVGAPSEVRGWPYVTSMTEDTLSPPNRTYSMIANNFSGKTRLATVGIDGYRLSGYVPVPRADTFSDLYFYPNQIWIGDIGPAQIQATFNTFAHPTTIGNYVIPTYPDVDVNAQIQARLAAGGGKIVTTAFPGDILLSNSSSTGSIGWFGLPHDWWIEIQFTALKVGNTVYYANDGDILFNNYGTDIAPTLNYVRDTSGNINPAKLWIRYYDTSTGAPPSPPGPATLLWNGGAPEIFDPQNPIIVTNPKRFSHYYWVIPNAVSEQAYLVKAIDTLDATEAFVLMAEGITYVILKSGLHEQIVNQVFHPVFCKVHIWDSESQQTISFPYVDYEEFPEDYETLSPRSLRYNDWTVRFSAGGTATSFIEITDPCLKDSVSADPPELTSFYDTSTNTVLGVEGFSYFNSSLLSENTLVGINQFREYIIEDSNPEVKKPLLEAIFEQPIDANVVLVSCDRDQPPPTTPGGTPPDPVCVLFNPILLPIQFNLGSNIKQQILNYSNSTIFQVLAIAPYVTTI